MKLNAQYATTIRYLMICNAGLLAFIIMGIVPNQMVMLKIDNTIAALKHQLAEQETLFPIYNELVRKIQNKTDAFLPEPALETLAKGDTDRPSLDINALAVRHHLRLKGITPDLDHLINGGADFLRFKATVVGAFNSFQPFLMDLGKLAYLEALETVSIRAVDNDRELFVQLTVRQKK